MLLVATGLLALVPNVVALGGLLALLLAVQLQVRWAEEPYLARLHGPAYAAYAARAGRFVPGVGRRPGG
jgi:protein-S-isoprenylcysteine O-methyltransferase Ste14